MLKQRFLNLIGNKSFSNGIWLYALQFFNLVVPLLTLPYITRILGKESYGIFSIALNIVTYLQVFVEYGFGMSATRKVAIGGRKDLNHTFTAVVCSRFVLLLLSILISLAYIFINKNNTTLCISFAILIICLFGYCIQMNWAFQGMQEMKYISIVNVLGRSVSTLLIFVFVKKAEDIYLYSLLYSASPFLSGLVGLLIAKIRYSLKFVKITFEDIINELKDGFYIFTTQLSAKVFGMIGITFLGIYTASSEVGVFSAIQKIPNILILLWSPIAQIIYPIASKKFKYDFSSGYNYVMKTRRRVLPIFIAIAVIIGLFAETVVSVLFGQEYSAHFVWLYPLLCWLLVAIDNNFWGVQILLGSSHDREYGKAFNIGVAVTVLLNFVLIRCFNGFGAACAPLFSEIVLNILLRREAKSII